jgi:hypothetical protein
MGFSLLFNATNNSVGTKLLRYSFAMFTLPFIAFYILHGAIVNEMLPQLEGFELEAGGIIALVVTNTEEESREE